MNLSGENRAMLNFRNKVSSLVILGLSRLFPLFGFLCSILNCRYSIHQTLTLGDVIITYTPDFLLLLLCIDLLSLILIIHNYICRCIPLGLYSNIILVLILSLLLFKFLLANELLVKVARLVKILTFAAH